MEVTGTYTNLPILLILILIALPIITGFEFLQIFLSKMQSKWPGLVLPGCSFFLSLLAVFGVLLNTISGAGSAAGVIIGVIATFVPFNIPTVIYLVTYMIVRNNRKDLSKKNQEIQKMNIQDLE